MSLAPILILELSASPFRIHAWLMLLNLVDWLQECLWQLKLICITVNWSERDKNCKFQSQPQSKNGNKDYYSIHTVDLLNQYSKSSDVIPLDEFEFWISGSPKKEILCMKKEPNLMSNSLSPVILRYNPDWSLFWIKALTLHLTHSKCQDNLSKELIIQVEMYSAANIS